MAILLLFKWKPSGDCSEIRPLAVHFAGAETLPVGTAASGSPSQRTAWAAKGTTAPLQCDVFVRPESVALSAGVQALFDSATVESSGTFLPPSAESVPACWRGYQRAAQRQLARTAEVTHHYMRWREVDHPPHSPALSLCDFRASGFFKKALKGRRFGPDEEVKAAVMLWFRPHPR
jgi:hypothetical protein